MLEAPIFLGLEVASGLIDPAQLRPNVLYLPFSVSLVGSGSLPALACFLSLSRSVFHFDPFAIHVWDLTNFGLVFVLGFCPVLAFSLAVCSFFPLLWTDITIDIRVWRMIWRPALMFLWELRLRA